MEREVAEADDGIRLDRWFKRHHPGIPHAMLEKYLRKGAIRLDGKKAKSSDRLSAGQILRFPDDAAALAPSRAKKPAPDARLAEQAKGWVLYKDDRLLILNKPPGLAVQGGSGQGSRHLDALLDALRFESSERPRLVHRLDKDTSGVLLLARDARTAAELAKRFLEKDIEKIYLALVKGQPHPKEGVIDLPLSKIMRGKDSREAVDVDEEDGKRAVSEYRVLESLGRKLSWVELKPVTGRTHQLRVHMAAIGHPIIGDGKYGGSEAFVEGLELSPKLHLHARRIVLPRWRGRALDISAPMPDHMRKSAESLGTGGFE